MVSPVGTLGQPLVAAAQQYTPYWEEPLPVNRTSGISITEPGSPDSTFLDCHQVLSDDPDQPDEATIDAAGGWSINLDLGAHQAAHKLVCGPTSILQPVAIVMASKKGRMGGLANFGGKRATPFGRKNGGHVPRGGFEKGTKKAG